jgi:hypothetical protein
MSTDHVKTYENIDTNVNNAIRRTSPPAHFTSIDLSSGSISLKNVNMLFQDLAFDLFFFVFLFCAILLVVLP